MLEAEVFVLSVLLSNEFVSARHSQKVLCILAKIHSYLYYPFWSAFASTNAIIVIWENLHALYMWIFCFESYGCSLLIDQSRRAFSGKTRNFICTATAYPFLI